MTIEKDLNIVLELLEASRASVCGLRQHRQHAWDRFENAAGEFFEDHGPAILSALADQRRLREAEVREVGNCCGHITIDPDGGYGQDDVVLLHYGKRVAIVPLDQEGE